MFDTSGPDLTPEFEAFVVEKLKSIGFREVEVKLSPWSLSLKSKDLSKTLAENLRDFEELFENARIDEMNKYLTQLGLGAVKHTEELSVIDPIFREAGLGKAYILATR